MGNSTSALPYTVGKEVRPGDKDTYGFSIHEGTQKSDGTAVTVFRAKKSELARTPLLSTSTKNCEMQYMPALHHLKTSSSLVHPYVLKTYQCVDSDSQDDPVWNQYDAANAIPLDTTGSSSGELLMITEHVMTLEDYLQDLDPSEEENALAWGIWCLVEALDFLHTQAKCAHGNLSERAIYVTPSGDFKLSAFQLYTPIGIHDVGHVGPNKHFQLYERDVTPQAYRSPERMEARWDVISNLPPHVMDSYALGLFIEDLYTTKSQYLKALPQVLVKATQRMQTNHARMRPRLGPLKKCPLFVQNEFVQTQIMLSNLISKPSEERFHFLQTNLPKLLERNVLRKTHCVYKVFPLLKQILFNTIALASSQGEGGGFLLSDLQRREIMSVLNSLFFIMERYLIEDREQFTILVQPILTTLYKLADRGIRGALLQRTSIFEQGFGAENKNLLNKDLFEPMCSGFTDSSSPLRELTLKSCQTLVKHLTPTNIDKLSRYLIRLQSDSEPSIRTNSMIFIGKIMIPHLGSKEKTEKLLLPAFSRAMRPEEDFIPCRMAALKSIFSCATKTKALSPQTIAQKVLPLVVPHVLDPSSMEVRVESMKVVDNLLALLRTESEQMNSNSIRQERNQSAVATSTHNSQSTNSTTANKTASNSSSSYLSSFSLWGSSSTKVEEEPSSSSTAVSFTPAPTAAAPAPIAQSSNNMASLSLNATSNSFRDNGGWSDDDDDDNWDDDNDDKFAAKPAIVKTSVPPTMKLKNKSVTVKPTVKRLGGNVELGDGWDDF